MALTDEAIGKIKEMITSGELGPGDRLPKEADLADNRRRAMHQDVPLNVIQRQPGHRNLGMTSIYHRARLEVRDAPAITRFAGTRGRFHGAYVPDVNRKDRRGAIRGRNRVDLAPRRPAVLLVVAVSLVTALVLWSADPLYPGDSGFLGFYLFVGVPYAICSAVAVGLGVLAHRVGALSMDSRGGPNESRGISRSGSRCACSESWKRAGLSKSGTALRRPLDRRPKHPAEVPFRCPRHVTFVKGWWTDRVYFLALSPSRDTAMCCSSTFPRSARTQPRCSDHVQAAKFDRVGVGDAGSARRDRATDRPEPFGPPLAGPIGQWPTTHTVPPGAREPEPSRRNRPRSPATRARPARAPRSGAAGRIRGTDRRLCGQTGVHFGAAPHRPHVRAVPTTTAPEVVIDPYVARPPARRSDENRLVPGRGHRRQRAL